MKDLNIFRGRKLVIATMHGKEQVIAPLLEKHLGVEIVIPKDFNSDKFGTFTGEIKRAGNQLEAARAKLHAAMEIEGLDLGVASEGSFGAHPSIPFVQSNLELLLFVDKKNGYEIRGHHRTSETNMNGKYVSSVEEALFFAEKHDFPSHGLILKFNEKGHFKIYKDVLTIEDLSNRVKKMLSVPFVKRIFLETDMRAHKNPVRMKAIEQATIDLLKNIQSVCPECTAPGFIAVDFEKGLPCSLCKTPTDLPVYDLYRCEKCHFFNKKEVTKYGKLADPRYCGYCNP